MKKVFFLFNFSLIILALTCGANADDKGYPRLSVQEEVEIEQLLKERLRLEELEYHSDLGPMPSWRQDKKGALKYVKDFFGVKLLSAEVMVNDDFKKFTNVELGTIRGMIIKRVSSGKDEGITFIDFELYSGKDQRLADCRLYFETSRQLAQLAVLESVARSAGTPAKPPHVWLKKFTLQNDVGDWDIINSKEKSPNVVFFSRKNTAVVIDLEEASPTSLLEIAQAIDAILLGKEQIDLSQQAARKLESEQKKKLEEEKRKAEELARSKQEEADALRQSEEAGKLTPRVDDALESQKSEIEQMRKWFKFPEGSRKLVVPNVNKGKVKLSTIQGLWSGKVMDNTEDPRVCIFNFENDKGRVVVVYASSQKQAQEVMLMTKLVGSGDIRQTTSVEEKCRSVRLDTKTVGDVALIRVPDQDEFTNPIPGTGESEVYFVRNNTAVALRSMDPKQSMLKMAKAIDAVLKGK